MSETTTLIEAKSAEADAESSKATGASEARFTTSQRRRTLSALMVAQIMAGLAHGMAFSMGSLLAAKLQGPAWGGTALALTMGGAALWAIPLGRIVHRYDRRISLIGGLLLAMAGAASALTGAQLHFFPLVLAGFLLLGGEIAMNYQARFAATDVSDGKNLGRDLSLVLWSTTIGAVVGPQLFEVTEQLGGALKLEEFTGAYLVCLGVQLVGVLTLAFALPKGIKPAVVAEPAQPSAQSTEQSAAQPAETDGRQGLDLTTISTAISIAALSHFAMIAIMAMSAVHMKHHHASLGFIGIVISGHVGAMYVLAPLFGLLVDRRGPWTAVGTGAVLNIAAGATIYLSGHDNTGVLIGMVILGFGWSATLIGSSALLLTGTPLHLRTKFQGRSDLIMNLSGAAGGLLAGPIASAIGLTSMSGIITVLIAVQFIAVAAVFSRRRNAH